MWGGRGATQYRNKMGGGGIGKQRWGVSTCSEKSKGEELTGVVGVGAGKNTDWVRCWSGN